MLFKIDIRSFVIGVLSITCILMFMGYGGSTDGHFDTVYANKVILEDSDYKQTLTTVGGHYYNKDANISMIINPYSIAGYYDLWGNGERATFEIYTDDNHSGRFFTYNRYGKTLIALTKDTDGNGLIQANSSYGDAGAQLIGSGRVWSKY